jgi:putative holliday junction resolvase
MVSVLYTDSMMHMGIDMGTKRVGIARSDATGSIAFAQKVVPADAHLVHTLLAMIVVERVEVVVIGLSTGNGGVANPIAARAEALGAALADAHVKVVYEWEGYSSAHARTLSRFSEGGHRGAIARKLKQPKREHIDAGAAAQILQSYLDRRS